MKCLVIDDDEQYCELISQILNRYGVEVTYCNSFECADNKIKDTLFDWILVDVIMPHGNGVEWIREHNHLESKMFLLTGDLDDPRVSEPLARKSLIYNGNILKHELVEILDGILREI